LEIDYQIEIVYRYRVFLRKATNSQFEISTHVLPLISPKWVDEFSKHEQVRGEPLFCIPSFFFDIFFMRRLFDPVARDGNASKSGLVSPNFFLPDLATFLNLSKFPDFVFENSLTGDYLAFHGIPTKMI
jgi:hypothetical protein